LTSEGRTSRQADLEGVRQKIAVGLDQARRGELFDGESVFQEILETLGRPSGDTPVQSPDRSR
jgi:hypothetical protein